jgi:EAL domain-containing protein (putative c-di-GMP-specific phosphodiesterase class I)
MGVTIYPQDGSDADLLMRHADQAMYAAKQAGKNRYHLFDVENEVAVKARRESVDRIRTALEQREFVLHYQPKVDLRKREVVGVEALIRWQHPQRGLLPPADFLPFVEDHPISIAIGEWVIETALAQMRAWKTDSLTLHVSVNVGALQMQQRGFVVWLAEMLKTYPDVPAHQLELEILETSALDDIGEVSQTMQACRAVGVRFALDDFGTGYSSLTYLKHLPAEMIKIDQSFVRDMLSDVDDLSIVRGVIGLSVAFGRSVIAEGVETEAHCAQLLAMGCDLAQGYGIARPMPAQDVPSWVAQWTVSGSPA